MTPYIKTGCPRNNLAKSLQNNCISPQQPAPQVSHAVTNRENRQTQEREKKKCKKGTPELYMLKKV